MGTFFLLTWYSTVKTCIQTIALVLSPTRIDLITQQHQLLLIDTAIQNDEQLQTKEIPSTSNSKQIKPQICPETDRANYHLVHIKGGF